MRKTVHIDVSKRKAAKNKRTYEVAFSPANDPCFNKQFVRCKRIRMSDNESLIGGIRQDAQS